MTEAVERRVVLVVDDDPNQCAALLRLLHGLGYQAVAAQDGAAALQLAAESVVAVAIVDLNLPGIHGYEVIRRLKQSWPHLDCVVLTGENGAGVAAEARANGASDYFEKPIRDMTRFQQVVRRSFEVYELRRAIDLKGPRTTNLLGASPAVLRVRDLVRRMAGSQAPVLITGESGVGKEVVAEALHERSNAKGEFVRINCAAVPESLIEVELFGAEDGSFTGQVGRRVGLLSVAREGTLFLDEIGDMPLGLQPKLLHALQSRKFRPIGARAEQDLTARIVAATNIDLEQACASGRFRQDLFFRIAVLRIEVPPLRQRPEDLPILLTHFLRQHAHSEGRLMPRIAEDLVARLLAYPWPGNVRELGNAALRAVIMAGDEVRWEDFGLDGTSPAVASTGCDYRFDLPLAEAKEAVVHAFVDAYVREHLRRAGGNISHAAQAAGMERANFKRLVRRYDVDLDD